MYTVFFGERSLILSSSPEKASPSLSFDAIHKYSTPNELRQFVGRFAVRDELKHGCIYFHNVDALWTQFCLLFRCIEAAGGVVQNANNELLVIERRGYVDLPKGKAEAGETPQQNALREVCEETGLQNLHLIRHLADTYHTYQLDETTVLKHTSWFAMRTDGVPELKPQTEEDIVSARWVTPAQFHTLAQKTYVSLREVFTKEL